MMSPGRVYASTVVVLALCCIPSQVWAQPAPAAGIEVVVPPDVPPGADIIEPVTRSARAPFDGQLLSTDTAIRWTNRLRWYRETMTRFVAQHDEIITALNDSNARAMSVVSNSLGREIQGLRTDLRTQARLLQPDPVPFYKTWGFAFALGCGLATVIVGFVAYALTAI